MFGDPLAPSYVSDTWMGSEVPLVHVPTAAEAEAGRSNVLRSVPSNTAYFVIRYVMRITSCVVFEGCLIHICLPRATPPSTRRACLQALPDS